MVIHCQATPREGLGQPIGGGRKQVDYAESLTYWYLRLNGFFPITNFVLHQPKGSGQSGDCDVLAIRLPDVAETIANDDQNLVRCDDEFFGYCQVTLNVDTVGVIVQVKSGRYNVKRLEKSFSEDYRLMYACRRLGMFTTEEVNTVSEELTEHPYVRRRNRIVLKLLVDTERHKKNGEPKAEKPPWFRLSLEQVEAFIHERFREYKRHKSGSRMYFHDNLVQYLAWKADQNTATED